MASSVVPDPECDVLIVGFGPVGQVLSILLARQGWRVTVVERRNAPYPGARAVSFDGEGARILASAIAPEKLRDVGEWSREIELQNHRGDILFRMEPAEHGLPGWPDSTSFYQPELESALIEQAAGYENIRILRGREAVRIADCGAYSDVDVRSPAGEQRIRALWVIGCDGANSFVRKCMDCTESAFGFSFDWLVCDVVPAEPVSYVPYNLLICDPRRPRTSASAGPGHRRWEFMLLPGESPAELNTPEHAWKLLGLADIAPGNATLERHSVYRFRASLVDRWRAGRILLAGDAAHLMPPFTGQGMCSGFRDARNLAWKLDLVLRGVAPESLLDSYGVERRNQLRNTIELSVKLARVVCLTDEKLAAARDATMLASRARNTEPLQSANLYWPLGTGVLGSEGSSGGAGPVGRLMPQAKVASADRAGLFDEVVGTGFVLLTLGDPTVLLESGSRSVLSRLRAHIVGVLPGDVLADRLPPWAIADIDGEYHRYFEGVGARAILVRPDFYVFGCAPDGAATGLLVRKLADKLGMEINNTV